MKEWFYLLKLLNRFLWLKLVQCIGIRVLLHIWWYSAGCGCHKIKISIYLSFVSNLMLINLVSHMDSKMFIETNSFPNSKLQFRRIFAFFQAGRRCGFHRKAILNMHQPSWNFKHASFCALPQTFINTQP